MQQRKELIHFKDNIPDCQNQKYMVDSNDFCLNRNNCKVIRGYSYDKFRFQIMIQNIFENT